MKIYQVTGQSFSAYEGGCMERVIRMFVTKKSAEEYIKEELNKVVSYVTDIENEIGESFIEIDERRYVNHPLLHTASVTFHPHTTDIPNAEGEPVYHFDEKTAELVMWFSGLGDYKCDKLTASYVSDIKLLELSISVYETDNLK